MIDELRIASELLDSALNRYLDACLMIQKHYLERSAFTTIPPELSSNITAEVNLIPTFEARLSRATSTIYWIRNCTPALVPIHTLPQELLERIFLFASSSYHRHSYDGWYWDRRADDISHVCSRWREMVLNLPSLWSFIRLPLTYTGKPIGLNRAIAYAERASPLALNLQFNIRVKELFNYVSEVICIPPMIPNILPRISSLEFAISFGMKTPSRRDTSAISTCLTLCDPKTLTTLITSGLSTDHRYWFFDVAAPLPDYLDTCGRIININALEDVLSSINILRLSGFYPFWTSKAYHGLVELRMAPKNTQTVFRGPISESHLLGILRASPALRIFEFDLEVVESLPEGTSIVPVHLNYLESFKVGPIACQKLGSIFRWLFLGSSPLQLSLGDRYPNTHERCVFGDEIALFLSHSYIKEVHLNLSNISTLNVLLANCPHLQTLALETTDLSSPPEDVNYPIQHSRLQSLFLLHCRIDLHQAPIDSSVLKRLLFQGCNYKSNMGPYTYSELHSDDLKHVNWGIPEARVISDNPIQGWAVFNA